MLNGRLESTGGILGVSGGQLASQDMKMKMMISPHFWTVLFKRCLDLLLMGFRLSLVLLILVVLMCIISTKNQAFWLCVFHLLHKSQYESTSGFQHTEQHGDGVRMVHAKKVTGTITNNYTLIRYLSMCIFVYLCAILLYYVLYM